MFRKKKNLGSVTELDESATDAPTDEFDDLGLNNVKRDEFRDGDMDQMTSNDLERLALKTANEGKESTARALRMAGEAREVGVNTASKMQSQTTQLEKMSEDIEEVHDYLDKSERLIDKMTKPKLARIFQRKKATGKGLDKVKAGKKETEARAEMRDKGLSALDIDAMNPNGVSMADIEGEREQLLDCELVADTPKKGLRFGRKKEVERKDPRQIREDYSQYAEPVADVMRKQDDDLDQIADALSDMRNLAGAMNNEIAYQETLIEEVQGFTAETSRRTKENAKKIKRIK